MTASEKPLRPRVLYFINSFDLGGAELGLVQLVEGGVFAGCDLRIVAIVRGRGGLEEKLAAVGHAPSMLLDKPRMRVSDLAFAAIRFRRLLARQQPDLLILSLPQANLIGRLCAGRRRPPIVASFEHNTHLAKPLYEVGYRWTSPRVDWLLADSANTADEARRRLYRHAPPTTTIVPLVEFKEGARKPRATSSSSAPFHIVNAARLTPIKNQAAIIEAVALLVERGRDVRLTLYGEGAYHAACKAHVDKLHLESRIEFAGYVADWMAQPADLFVLSSKHEGLCMSVLEAMHAGIPVAAPLIGGLRDYGGADVMTTLASIEPQAIADAVEAVMNDRPAANAKAVAAAEMVSRRYGAATIAASYRQINQLIIAKCAAARTS